MKTYLALMAAIAGATAITLPAMAEGGKQVCFRTIDIDHTSTPDDNTILFHMRHHKVYKASLINRCVGLRTNTSGFTYSPTIPGSNEICANLLTVTLNDTGQSCLVGDIALIDEPARAAN